MKMPKTIRMNVSEEKLVQIDDLIKRGNLATRKNLINEALTVYSRFLQLIEQGYSLPYVESPEGVQKEIAIASYLEVYERVQLELKMRREARENRVL